MKLSDNLLGGKSRDFCDYTRRACTLMADQLSASELRARAIQYRAMARTTATQAIAKILLRLAERFEELATQQDHGSDRC
jgi:hypothetical protein